MRKWSLKTTKRQQHGRCKQAPRAGNGMCQVRVPRHRKGLGTLEKYDGSRVTRVQTEERGLRRDCRGPNLTL